MHSWLVKVKGGLSAKEKGKAATKLFLELDLHNKSATKKAKTGRRNRQARVRAQPFFVRIGAYG
jgi:hypothetical protein